MKAHRPTIMGTRHMIAATQYLAAEAGFKILEAGGNAIDAGVAAGISLPLVLLPQLLEPGLASPHLGSERIEFAQDGLAARFDAGLFGLRLLDEADHALAMAGEDDLLPLLDRTDQLGELALGLVDGNRLHIWLDWR